MKVDMQKDFNSDMMIGLLYDYYIQFFKCYIPKTVNKSF